MWWSVISGTSKNPWFIWKLSFRCKATRFGWTLMRWEALHWRVWPELWRMHQSSWFVYHKSTKRVPTVDQVATYMCTVPYICTLASILLSRGWRRFCLLSRACHAGYSYLSRCLWRFFLVSHMFYMIFFWGWTSDVVPTEQPIFLESRSLVYNISPLPFLQKMFLKPRSVSDLGVDHLIFDGGLQDF